MKSDVDELVSIVDESGTSSSIVMPIGHGFAGCAARGTGEIVRASYTADDMRFAAGSGSRYENVKAVLCVPIVASADEMSRVENEIESHNFQRAATSDLKVANVGDHKDDVVVGVIEVTKVSAVPFTDNDVNAIQMLALQVLKAAFKEASRSYSVATRALP